MQAAQTNTHKQITVARTQDEIAFNDFKNSVLILSLLANAFVFTAWLTLQVTDQYNAAVVHALVG